MALNRQLLPLSFKSGLDLKTDPKQTPQGALQILQNATFSTPMALSKRFGNAALSTKIGNSSKGLTHMKVGRALMSYNDELIACDQDTLYSYDPGASEWVEKGSLVSASLTQAPVVNNTYQQVAQDSVVHANGVQLSAWIDSSNGGVVYSLKNYNTNQILVSPTQVSSTSTVPKVARFGVYLALYYMDSVGGSTSHPLINVILFSAYNPTVAIGPTSLTAGSGGGFQEANANLYDVTVQPGTTSDQLYLAFANDVSGTTVYSYLSSLPTALVNSTTVNVQATEVALWIDGHNSGPVLSTASAASLNRVISIFNWTPFTTSVPSLIINTSVIVGSASSFIVIRLAGVCEDPASGGNYDVFLTQYDGSSTLNAHTFRVPVRTGTPGVLEPVSRCVTIAAKPYAYGGRTYIPVVYVSPLNSTAFIIDNQALANGRYANTIARFLGGLAATNIPNDPNGPTKPAARVPETTALSDTQFVMSYLTASPLTTLPVTTSTTLPDGTPVNTTATFTQTGVTCVTVDMFDPTLSYSRAVLAGTLYVSGGYVYQYDSAQVTEQGFHVYPEITQAQAVGSNTGGNLGSLTQDTEYFYVGYYAWTDHQGNIQRSTPSIPVSVKFASGVNTGSVTLTAPTLRIGNKVNFPGVSTPVLLQFARTIGTAPGVFYSANVSVTPVSSGGTNQPIINTTLNDTVTFIDHLSDANIIGNPRLYSTGGVLENEAPNPLIGLTVWQNRLLGIDSMNPTTVWYSQEVIAGAPVEFSSFLELSVDPGVRSLTALGVVDTFLYLYGESQTYFTQGQGPDGSGAQNQIAGVLLNTTEVGCINPRSVVRTQKGLMSQSTKGIYLEDREQNSGYIGFPVEGLVNGHDIISSLIVPKYNQVRFLLDSGNVVVFDTFMQQWSEFTSYLNAVDACIYGDEWAYLDSTGQVFQEVADSYSDHGAAITMSLKTAPIRLSEVISSYQRVWSFYINGTYQSPHDIVVKVSFDGSPAYQQLTPVTPPDPTVWGSDPYWGASNLWGGEPFVPYIFRVFIQNEQCESLQIELDVTPTGNVGGGAQLSGLTFELGTMRGGYKTAQVAQF